MGDECDKEVAYLTQLSVRPFNNEPDSLYTVHPIEDSWFETTYATAIEKSCVTLIPRSECKTAQTVSANYLKSFLHSPTSLHLDSSSSTQILCERYKRECNRSEENFSSNPVGQQTIRSFNSNRSETNDNNKNEQFVRNKIAQNTNPKQKNKIYPSIFCCFRDSSLNRPTKESLIVDSKSTVNSKPPSNFAIRESTTNDESIVRDAHNTESEKMGRERCHEVTDADVVLRTSMDECSKSVRSSKWLGIRSAKPDSIQLFPFSL
ncbi:hypothetical protein AB6A40_008654 [Gnathostoma spinigerum]|uniref:Breast cancer type 1 susceptibility protein n=1 Tax=Gnathostoma spinigerum TaxID=75299 RepID=A0ABD6F005_9BILA